MAVAASALEYVPATQDVHADARLAAEVPEYVPALQDVQAATLDAPDETE